MRTNPNVSVHKDMVSDGSGEITTGVLPDGRTLCICYSTEDFIAFQYPEYRPYNLSELTEEELTQIVNERVAAYTKEKEEPKKEEVAEEKEELDSTRKVTSVKEAAKTIKIENSLGLDNTTNKAYAEMIWRFDGHDKFNKVVARLSEEERKEVVSILNDPEVLENPKSPKVEKAYEILRKHRLDMEKELTDEDKQKQQEENETGGFEDVLAICRSIDGLKETSNESKTVFKFSYKGKLCIILQKTSTDYRMAFMAEPEDYLKYIINIKYRGQFFKPRAPKGDYWFLHINKGHFPISQMRTIIEKADQTLKRLLREAGLDKEDEEPSNSNEPKDKTLKSKGPKEKTNIEKLEERGLKIDFEPGITPLEKEKLIEEINNMSEQEFEDVLAGKKRIKIKISRIEYENQQSEQAEEKQEEPAQPKPTKTQRGVQKIIDNKLAKLREKGIEVDVESMTEEELNEFRRDMQTHTHEQLKKLLPEKYSSYVTTKETSKKEQSQEENEEVVQEEKDLSNFEKVEKRLGFELKFDENVSEEEKENIKEWINNMTEEELEKFIKELKEKGVTKIKVKIPQPEEEDEPGQE